MDIPTGLAGRPPSQHGGPWPSAAAPFFPAVIDHAWTRG